MSKYIFSLDEGSEAYTLLTKSKAAPVSISFCNNKT